MALLSARDLKEDALFRSSEPISNSGWNAKAIDYLNRVYQTLASGASEFLPEYVEDWWWLRDKKVLTLDAAYDTGTVAVTKGSTSITFSSPPSSLTADQWKIRVANDKTVYTISAFSTPAATLDSEYTGDTNSAATFKLMHTVYDLDASVAALISPIIAFEYANVPQISGIAPERMDFLYPLSRLQPGAPQAFSLENEAVPDGSGGATPRIRFSHGGLTTGDKMRVEYRFRPRLTLLTDSASSYPIVPEQWRHILSDMATTLIMMDKNDDRANSVALLARTGLAGMLKENRRRLAKMDRYAGRVFPRNNRDAPGQPMTEGGIRLRW